MGAAARACPPARVQRGHKSRCCADAAQAARARHGVGRQVRGAGGWAGPRGARRKARSGFCTCDRSLESSPSNCSRRTRCRRGPAQARQGTAFAAPATGAPTHAEPTYRNGPATGGAARKRLRGRRRQGSLWGKSQEASRGAKRPVTTCLRVPPSPQQPAVRYRVRHNHDGSDPLVCLGLQRGAGSV